jgi:hypothetical protein
MYKSKVMLLALILVMAFTGSRLGSAGLDGGFLRSIHLVDIFAILTLPSSSYVVFSSQRDFFLKSLKIPILSWLLYCLLVPGFLSSLLWDQQTSLSIAFAFKEVLLISVFLFAYSCGRLALLLLPKLLIVFCLCACLWVFKECFLPSGLYFLGLPFEAGPSQSGNVYGLIAISSFSLLPVCSSLLLQADSSTFRSRRSSPFATLLKIPPWICVITLGFGSILSLSRTSLLSLLVCTAIICFFKSPSIMASLSLGKFSSSSVAAFFIILAAILWAVFLFFSDNLSALVTLIARIGESSTNSMDRISKWHDLIQFVQADPYSIFFGCGFNSPNSLVLGKEYGSILAVDNGYVRRIFEVGVFGLFLFLTIFWQVIRISWAAGCYQAVFPLVAFFFVSNLTIESFQVVQISYVFWIMLGISFAFCSRSPCKTLGYLVGQQ